MRPARLFAKILATYAFPNLAIGVVFLVFVSSWQRAVALRHTEQQLVNAARVAAKFVGSDLIHRPSAEIQRQLRELGGSTGLRLTIVAADGVVLGDSAEDHRRMANHRDRPEIQQALASGVGRDVRDSSTLGIAMFYIAVPVQRDDSNSPLVRVAMELSEMDREVTQARGLLWSLALATGLLAVMLTYLMVRRLVQPLSRLTAATQAIARGDYGQPVRVRGSDELGQLGAALEHMRSELCGRLQALQESREQLATVLGSMTEGVLAIDARQRLLFANQAARRLLSIGAAEVAGRTLIEVTRSRDVNETALRSIATADSIELEFDAPGTSRRRLLLRASRLPGEPPPGVVMVLHDVTELRRLETLRHELVANVSHELKTPLSSIKAYSETLRLGAIHDPEHNLRFLANIEEQADRLHQLIQDLMQLARVESGNETFDITAVELGQVARASAARHQAEADAKHIGLELVPPNDSVRVLVDEEALGTILDNLIGNAIRYTPEAGRVSIGWRTDGDRVTLFVQDTGLGIAPKHHSRVFERFYRVDPARSRELGGTGLGLSIVKHLAMAFGGQVSLTSALGEGSRFEVTLRLAHRGEPDGGCPY